MRQFLKKKSLKPKTGGHTAVRGPMLSEPDPRAACFAQSPELLPVNLTALFLLMFVVAGANVYSAYHKRLF